MKRTIMTGLVRYVCLTYQRMVEACNCASCYGSRAYTLYTSMQGRANG